VRRKLTLTCWANLMERHWLRASRLQRLNEKVKVKVKGILKQTVISIETMKVKLTARVKH
jgi:hypothetical protein